VTNGKQSGQVEKRRVRVRAAFKRQKLENVLNGNIDELVILQKETVERLEQIIIRLNNESI
jgi:hypothetical protein